MQRNKIKIMVIIANNLSLFLIKLADAINIVITGVKTRIIIPSVIIDDGAKLISSLIKD